MKSSKYNTPYYQKITKIPLFIICIIWGRGELELKVQHKFLLCSYYPKGREVNTYRVQAVVSRQI